MKRLSALSIIATTVLCLGIVLPTNYASAQGKSLKKTIIGTWSVTSVSDEYKDRSKNNAWGTGMKGALNFDNNGRFSHILIGEKEPNVESDDPRRPDALVVAYFGSYTVNERNKVVSVWIERGTNSRRDGEAQNWAVTMKGDTLSLTGSPHNDSQGPFSQHLEVKRAM